MTTETLEAPTSQARKVLTISGEKVTQNTAELPEAQQTSVRWLYAYARAEGWDWAELEKQSGISQNTIYKIWNDQYRNDKGERINLEGICERVDRLKKLVFEREGTQRGLFADTSIFRKVDKVCHEARIMQIIALIFGESQIGKTFSLLEHQRRNNHGQTLFLRMSSHSSGFFPGLAEQVNTSVQNSAPKILARAFGYIDHTKLLIVDEMHLPFECYNKRAIVRTLETLREIHDRTGCGLVLSGTNVFKKELHSGEFSRMLKQILRRGILPLQLPDVAPMEDVHAIAAGYKLDAPTGDAADLVKLIITHDGLGKFSKFLAKSSQFATKKKERLNWDHFVRVAELIEKLSH